MSQNQTGADLIKLLRQLSSETGKFFLPDLGREEAVAESLIDAYRYDDLTACANEYIKKCGSPVLVFSFAMEVPSIMQKAITERESREKFRSIVQKTKERMDQRK
jgi:hypothetical protein|tara:strand:- start:38 stop:352 length:315 start_codon:yes stop_codon:yes gene_type:complete